MHKTDFTGAPATQPWLQRECLLGVWPRVLEFIYALQQSIKQTSQLVYGNGRMIYAQLRGHPFFPTLPGQHPSLHSIHSGWCVFTRLMVIRPQRWWGGGSSVVVRIHQEVKGRRGWTAGWEMFYTEGPACGNALSGE